MERDEVMRWVEAYERAWRERDVDAVETLFTADASYRGSPYQEPHVGHAGIKATWLDTDDSVFTVTASPVTVDGRDAVVRLEVRYGDPVHQEFRDLWLLRFAADGRVEDFEEWFFSPPTAR